MKINGQVPILGNQPGWHERWVHPERDVEIDVEFDNQGIATITKDGLHALLKAAGWRRSK